jgi:hypothetical protein
MNKNLIEKDIYELIMNVCDEILILIKKCISLVCNEFEEIVDNQEIVFKIQSIKVHIEDMYYTMTTNTEQIINIRKEIDIYINEMKKLKTIIYFIHEKIYNHKLKYFNYYRTFDISHDLKMMIEIINKLNVEKINKLKI